MVTIKPGRAQVSQNTADIISRSVEACGRIVVPCGAVFALAALPGLVSTLMLGQVPDTAVRPFPVVLLTLLGVVLDIAALAIGICATEDALAGREPNLGAGLNVAIARFFPLLGTAFGVGIAIMVGFILLVVPGFYMAAVLYVALPICLLEKRSPIDSFRASYSLTEGFRWTMFATLIVLLAAAILATALSYFINLVLGGVVAAFLQLAINAAVGVLNTAVSVVAYKALRQSKGP